MYFKYVKKTGDEMWWFMSKQTINNSKFNIY